MRTKALRLVILCCIVGATACDHLSPNNPPPGNGRDSAITYAQVIYKYKSALADVQRYRAEQERLYGNRVAIEGFTIHAEDLLAALGWPKVKTDSTVFKYVRAYIGLDSANNFKLFLLPVSGADLSSSDKRKWRAGMDVLLDSNGHPLTPTSKRKGDDDDDAYVLDLNAPCPNTCPTAGGAFPPPLLNKKR